MQRIGPAVLLATAFACGGPPAPKVQEPPVPVSTGTVVSAADFGEATQQVLDGKANGELLVGVVRRQLERSQHWFDEGLDARGVAAVTGALYLVPVGKFQASMIHGESAALSAAAAEVAAAGDEGSASALYTLLVQSLPPGSARNDAKDHLKALAGWMARFSGRDQIVDLARLQRFHAFSALLDPTPLGLEKASDATVNWIDQAVEVGLDAAPAQTHAQRERSIQTYRALSSGGAALVALYLRNGDARGALHAIERGEAPRTVPGALRNWLEMAASGTDPEGWGSLFEWYHGAAAEPSETGIDAELAKAAAWGAAVEYYRALPTSMRAAMALGWMLEQLGMTEVAPLVLAGAVNADPAPEKMSAALTLILRGILRQDAEGDRLGARRTFANAAPILARAATAPELTETAAGAYYAMAAIESRAAELEQARIRAKESVNILPSVDAYALVARVDRQRGDRAGALEAVSQMAELGKAMSDSISQARAELMAFEIYRQTNSGKEAGDALDRALRAALNAKARARQPNEEAASERLLARVLEHYGQSLAARRATERAFQASRGDSLQLEATIMDSARRGLITGDLGMSRGAVQRALEMNLPSDDIVYTALWLSLVQQRKGADSDGTVEDALAASEGAQGWPGTLRDWALGKLSATELQAHAQDEVQKTEAEFYVAMAKSGELREALLSKVANSSAIDLIEVGMARELTAKRPLKVEVPKDVQLP